MFNLLSLLLHAITKSRPSAKRFFEIIIVFSGEGERELHIRRTLDISVTKHRDRLGHRGHFPKEVQVNIGKQSFFAILIQQTKLKFFALSYMVTLPFGCTFESVATFQKSPFWRFAPQNNTKSQF